MTETTIEQRARALLAEEMNAAGYSPASNGTPTYVAIRAITAALTPQVGEGACEDTRDSIIAGMCMTWDHSYGLMTGDQQNALWRSMEQLYEHDVLPAMQRAAQPKAGALDLQPVRHALQEARDQLALLARDPDNNPWLKECDEALAILKIVGGL